MNYTKKEIEDKTLFPKEYHLFGRHQVEEINHVALAA
jgi:hypothetical protein